MNTKGLKDKLLIGISIISCGIVSSLGISYARVIPGVDRPFDPGSYYDPYRISYADSPSVFTYRDMAGSGGDVWDVQKELKNILVKANQAAEELSQAEKVKNIIKNSTSLGSEFLGDRNEFAKSALETIKNKAVDPNYNREDFMQPEDFDVDAFPRSFNTEVQHKWELDTIYNVLKNTKDIEELRHEILDDAHKNVNVTASDDEVGIQKLLESNNAVLMDKILMERTVGNSLDNLSTLISVNERRLAEEKNRIRAGKMHMSAIDPSNREYYEAIKEMYGWERGKVEAFPDFK